MTKAEIFIQIISELSGAPKQEVAELLSTFMRVHPAPAWDEIIPDDEIDELLTGLRAEAPGILAWLIEGARSVGNFDSNTCH